ncbi:MAG: hypothetical protein ACPGVG_00470 [Mycobacterium sp.]
MCFSGGKQRTSEEERALAQIGAATWNDYQDRYVPLEDQFSELTADAEWKHDMAATVASADSAAANVGSLRALAAAPAGSRGQAASDFASASALGRASALVQGEHAVEGAAQDAKTRMVKFGRQLDDDTHVSLRQAASRGNAAAQSEAALRGQRHQFWGESLAGAAGYGMRRYNTNRTAGNPTGNIGLTSADYPVG